MAHAALLLSVVYHKKPAIVLVRVASCGMSFDLTRGGLGWGVNITPSRIFSIAQKRRQISTSNFQIRHLKNSAKQNFRKSVQTFLRKWYFSEFMFRHFGSKGGKSLKDSTMYHRFEVKRNPKASKDV